MSKRYLAWERQNHEANLALQSQACGKQPEHRLIRDDARVFIRRARAKGLKFKYIILDPPTFSKAMGKPFKASIDFQPLLEDCLACLALDGSMLASINEAAWEAGAFQRMVADVAAKSGRKCEPGRLPEGFAPDHPLKSFWISSA